MRQRPPSHARVVEFVAALLSRHTYSVRDNVYLWFGFLWGLPVPAVSIGIDLAFTGRPIGDAWSCMVQHPIHFVFLLHPAFFAVVFGALGTMAHLRDERIRDLVDRLSGEARTDGLTGLLNHRAFYEALHAEVDRARRQKTPLSCLLIDVDHFKLVNDRWGHRAGDRVLSCLAARIRKTSRPYDVVSRYGGEEIAILLPGAGMEEARSQAERIRRAVEAEPLDGGYDTPPLRVTVSVGVAVLGVHANEGSRLVDSADKAMYSAKRGGRNRVCSASLHATAVFKLPGL